MTSLETMAGRLDTILSQLGDADRLSAQAETITTLRRELENPIAALAAVGEYSDEARDRGVIAARLSIAGASQVESAFRNAAEGLATSPDSGVAPDMAARLRAEIDGFRTEARDAASSSWQEYCRAHGPPEVPDEFLVAFDQLAPDAADNLRGQLEACEMHMSTQLPGAASMRAYMSAVSRIPELLSEFAGDDPEVEAFIGAVGAGGAQLDALTPTVRSWMSEHPLTSGHSMEDLFRVTLRRVGR